MIRYFGTQDVDDLVHGGTVMPVMDFVAGARRDECNCYERRIQLRDQRGHRDVNLHSCLEAEELP